MAAEPVNPQVEGVFRALVNISVVSVSYGEGRTYRRMSAGSGVVVTAEGHVLTNFHVAGHSVRLQCTFVNGATVSATVVAHDPLTDLSVLKLEEREKAYDFAPLGDSDSLRSGQTVWALGNPLALSSSVTKGIVSSTERVFTDFGRTEMTELKLEGELTGLLTRWVQHDALIQPGNSGGPLVDEEGRVVGINELGGSGIGFAIPSNIAQDVLERVLENGRVLRGWLGFSILPIEPLGRTSGVLLADVIEGSSADAAGLQAGDMVHQLNQQPVTVRFFEEVPLFYQKVADLEIGESVTLELERDGERLKKVLKVEEMESFKGEEGEIRALGISVEEITKPQVIFERMPVDHGVEITGLRPGSRLDSAKPRLARGDWLTSLNGVEIRTLGDLKAFEDSEIAGPLVVGYHRGDEALLSVAESERAPSDSPWGRELPQAWLGLRTQVLIPALAEALGASGRRGYRITQVLETSPAAEAGLQLGDLLVGLDGEPLTAVRLQDRESLRHQVQNRGPGAVMRFTVLREGETLEKEVTLKARPRASAADSTHHDDLLEIAVRDVTLWDRLDGSALKNEEGVLVVEVESGGWAQVAGMKIDDLILEIDDEPCPNVQAYEKRLLQVRDAGEGTLKFFLRRGGRTHFIFVEIQANDF